MPRRICKEGGMEGGRGEWVKSGFGEDSGKKCDRK